MVCQKSPRRGFTLIELLVVIAIIALLIGILIPTLSKARLTAQTVKSKANLRSMGQIQQLYAGDFRDSYINPFNTQKTPQQRGDIPGGWAAATKPGLDPNDYYWEFSGPSPWYSEMYAFHWYSLIAGWISTGDYASEVQFAPADRTIITRFAGLSDEYPGFNLTTGVWDSSYILSPTLWFSPRRYKDDHRPETRRLNGPKSLAKRNRVASTSFPSSKVIIWERFDWTKSTRHPTIPHPIDPDAQPISFADEATHPQWNNTDAQPNALTADGSVLAAKISDIQELGATQSSRYADTFRPTDAWNPPSSLIENYGMDQDGFEIGSALVGFGKGQYPAYFWATRDGIKGRDVVR